MLTRHLRVIKRYIPYTEERYVIDDDFSVTDLYTDKRIPTSTDSFVELHLLGELRKVKLAWLVAITFKPVFMAEDFILSWTIVFHDDCSNVHPSNLHWKPPLGGQPCQDQIGFRIVPGFSRLSVSDDGRVWLRTKKRFAGIRTAPNDYRNVGTQAYDGDQVTVGVHRLMGLAWLPYDNRVNKMTINHKDGVKNRNVIDNLEWTTYGENNKHAMDLSLRDVRVPVEIKDYYSGEVVRYKSLTEASEFLNVNSGTLYTHLANKGTPWFDVRYCAKYPGESSWPDVTIEELKRKKADVDAMGLVAFNSMTNVTFCASTHAAIAKKIGSDRQVIRGYIRRKSFHPTAEGWHFFRVMDKTKFIDWFKKKYPDHRLTALVSDK